MIPDELPPELRRVLGQVVCVAFDFDGVFTDNRVFVDQDGIESVVCSRADGLGLDKLRAFGIELMVLSTEENPVVAARCAKLRLRSMQGLADKGAALAAELARLGIPAERTVFMGNDINDTECLALVGMPVVVADAHPDVLPLARLVTHTRGGLGAVREVCDLIAQCQADSQGGIL